MKARPSVSRALYTLAFVLALPLILARLAWRARRQRGYLCHLRERFGLSRARPGAPVIWVHAVSVGETRAAQPLIALLLARYPDHQILLTHMTPTGRDTGAQLYGGKVVQCYLPYDLPPACHAFLTRWHPRVGVLIETELWPNLVAAAQARGVPLVLANARLSARSARGYGRIEALFRPAFAALAAVGAQSGDDAVRLRALGAPHVATLGNLKFDIAPPADRATLAAPLAALFGPRPVLLLASTREDEEAPLVDAFLAAPRPPGTLLVVVPRHPQRFDAVAALLDKRGLRVVRRSAGQPVGAQVDAVLGDTMGEMFAYYAAAHVAIIGGSWLPLGGQNLIEACAVGTPPIVGPHTFNFAEASERAVACGAALRAADAAEALRLAGELLRDGPRRTAMGEAALAFAAAHRGAAQATLELVSRAMR